MRTTARPHSASAFVARVCARRAARVILAALLTGLGFVAPGQAQVDPPYPHLVNVYLAGDVDSTIVAALSKWDAVVLLNSVWTPGQLDDLRSRNPDIKIFLYVISYVVSVAPTTPWNQVNTAYVQNNDLWWYDVDRNVASDWPGYGMVNVTDRAPVGPQGSWREFFVSRVADLVTSYPQLDGVYLDNFWRQLSWQQAQRRLDSDCNPTHNPAGCDGVMDTNAVLDSLWHAGLVDIASSLRARFDQLQAGRPRPLAILSNGAADYFQWLNGTLTEYFPSGHGDVDFGNPYGYNWNHEMFDCPGGYVVAPFNPVPYRFSILNSEYYGTRWTPAREPNFERHKRFTLASSLFESGYYSLDSGHGGNQNLWWEPEYDHAGRGKGYLGLPLGPAQRILFAAGAELLTNPDFGAGTATWLADPTGAVGQFGADGATWHSPPYSGRIDVQSVAPSGHYKVWQAPIPMTQGQTYTLSLWARGTAAQTLEVELYGDDCPGLRCWFGREFCLSNQWTRFESSFVSSGTAATGLNLFLREPGTVWVDDLSLRTGDTSLFRRDFEHGIVLVNYTNLNWDVDLETTYYRLQIPNSAVFDGAAVDRETIPFSDARILLRDPPSPLPPPPPPPPPSDAMAPLPPPYLAQNVPNPFNPRTRIRFRLPAESPAPAPARLAVYDVAGRLVRVLLDGERAGGVDQVVEWDGRDAAGRAMPSGLYFYRITAPGFTQARKMLMAR